MELARKDRREAGSCNACRESKYKVDEVLEVRLQTLTFRLCPACEKELKRRLNKRF